MASIIGPIKNISVLTSAFIIMSASHDAKINADISAVRSE